EPPLGHHHRPLRPGQRFLQQPLPVSVLALVETVGISRVEQPDARLVRGPERPDRGRPRWTPRGAEAPAAQSDPWEPVRLDPCSQGGHPSVTRSAALTIAPRVPVARSLATSTSSPAAVSIASMVQPGANPAFKPEL